MERRTEIHEKASTSSHSDPTAISSSALSAPISAPTSALSDSSDSSSTGFLPPLQSGLYKPEGAVSKSRPSQDVQDVSFGKHSHPDLDSASKFPPSSSSPNDRNSFSVPSTLAASPRPMLQTRLPSIHSLLSSNLDPSNSIPHAHSSSSSSSTSTSIIPGSSSPFDLSALYSPNLARSNESQISKRYSNLHAFPSASSGHTSEIDPGFSSSSSSSTKTRALSRGDSSIFSRRPETSLHHQRSRGSWDSSCKKVDRIQAKATESSAKVISPSFSSATDVKEGLYSDRLGDEVGPDMERLPWMEPSSTRREASGSHSNLPPRQQPRHQRSPSLASNISSSSSVSIHGSGSEAAGSSTSDPVTSTFQDSLNPAYATSQGRPGSPSPQEGKEFPQDWRSEVMRRRRRMRTVRKRKREDENQQTCLGCAATETPEWRKGPTGPRSLCNACGLQWKKISSRLKGASSLALSSQPTSGSIGRTAEENEEYDDITIRDSMSDSQKKGLNDLKELRRELKRTSSLKARKRALRKSRGTVQRSGSGARAQATFNSNHGTHMPPSQSIQSMSISSLMGGGVDTPSASSSSPSSHYQSLSEKSTPFLASRSLDHSDLLNQHQRSESTSHSHFKSQTHPQSQSQSHTQTQSQPQHQYRSHLIYPSSADDGGSGRAGNLTGFLPSLSSSTLPYPLQRARSYSSDPRSSNSSNQYSQFQSQQSQQQQYQYQQHRRISTESVQNHLPQWDPTENPSENERRRNLDSDQQSDWSNSYRYSRYGEGGSF